MNLLFLLALVASSPAQGTVISPVANMYSGPSTDTDVVSQAIYGTNVGILEEKEGWAQVRTRDEYKGWMPLTSLRPLSPGDPPYATTGRDARVASLSANLYREPDVTKHAPLLTVPFETRLEVAKESAEGEERWVEVRLAGGGSAWVQRGDLDFNFRPLSIKQTIALARRFLGITYLWGGTSSFGFDCSGFTQMLVRQRGIIMPRDADLQAAWSGVNPVKRKKLKSGDLLFFGNSPEHITHTGMFIGHGRFIHDTTYQHPGVQISRLADPYWSRLLVACRRVQAAQIRFAPSASSVPPFHLKVLASSPPVEGKMTSLASGRFASGQAIPAIHFPSGETAGVSNSSPLIAPACNVPWEHPIIDSSSGGLEPEYLAACAAGRA